MSTGYSPTQTSSVDSKFKNLFKARMRKRKLLKGGEREREKERERESEKSKTEGEKERERKSK